MSDVASIELSDLNTMSDEQFVELLGDVFERSDWVARGVLDRRPFQSLRSLHTAMCETVADAGKRQQAELIRSHPDIATQATRLDDDETSTDEFEDEESGAGLDRLSELNYRRFRKLNDAYRARFGFPFIMCMREENVGTILSEFERRLDNDDEEEFAQALREIARIARFRLDAKLKHSD